MEVKGWRNGLLMVIPAYGDWETVLKNVEERLDEGRGRAFWKGAQATLDMGDRAVSESDLATLVGRLKEDFALVPVAVVATDAGTRTAAEHLVLTAYEVLPTVQMPATVQAEAARAALPPGAATALYLPSTVRSGQRVVHDGPVVVCGDVNAGAEVLAAGDVLIFGTLRGLAHAGYQGDESARIFALSLRPPQLRIAGMIARSPEGETRSSAPRGPEVARIENGEIGVSNW